MQPYLNIFFFLFFIDFICLSKTYAMHDKPVSPPSRPSSPTPHQHNQEGSLAKRFTIIEMTDPIPQESHFDKIFSQVFPLFQETLYPLELQEDDEKYLKNKMLEANLTSTKQIICFIKVCSLMGDIHKKRLFIEIFKRENWNPLLDILGKYKNQFFLHNENGGELILALIKKNVTEKDVERLARFFTIDMKMMQRMEVIYGLSNMSKKFGLSIAEMINLTICFFERHPHLDRKRIMNFIGSLLPPLYGQLRGPIAASFFTLVMGSLDDLCRQQMMAGTFITMEDIERELKQIIEDEIGDDVWAKRSSYQRKERLVSPLCSQVLESKILKDLNHSHSL